MDKEKNLKEIISSFPFIKYIELQLLLARISKGFMFKPELITTGYSDDVENLISLCCQHYWSNFYGRKLELNSAHHCFDSEIGSYFDKSVYNRIYRMLRCETEGGVNGAVKFIFHLIGIIEKKSFISRYISGSINSPEHCMQLSKEYMSKYKSQLPQELRSDIRVFENLKFILENDLSNLLEKQSINMSEMIRKRPDIFGKLNRDIIEKPIIAVKNEKRDFVYAFPPEMDEKRRALFVEWETGYKRLTVRKYRCPSDYCGSFDFKFERFENGWTEIANKRREERGDLPVFFPDRLWLARMNCNTCSSNFFVALEIGSVNSAYTISQRAIGDEWFEYSKTELHRFRCLYPELTKFVRPYNRTGTKWFKSW